MHRFTQRVARDRARKDDALIPIVNAAARLLGESLVPKAETWANRPVVDHLILQITELWESASPDLQQGAVDSHSDLASRLINLRCWVVQYLRELADPNSAIRLGRELLVDSKRILGSDHPHTLTAHYELARAYMDTGRIDEAITLHQQTLTNRQRILGPDHPDTLTSQHGLAFGYQCMGRVDEAVSLHERNLADREKVLGADHPDTLTSRYDLATAYRQMGRLDEAITLHEQALQDYQRVLSPGHPWLDVVSRSLESARRERESP